MDNICFQQKYTSKTTIEEYYNAAIKEISKAYIETVSIIVKNVMKELDSATH